MAFRLEKINETFYQALKNDIAIEIWNHKFEKGKDGNFFTINIYTLDSVYSEQYTLYFDSDSFCDSCGYHFMKKQETFCKRILRQIKEYLNNGGKMEKLEELFNHYKERSEAVFKAKYSIDADLKVYNLISV